VLQQLAGETGAFHGTRSGAIGLLGVTTGEPASAGA
jgi:hypothetical protein